MNPSDLSKLSAKLPLSESTRKRNLPATENPQCDTISPVAGLSSVAGSPSGRPKPPSPVKRIRQSTKPLLNKLESEWLAYAKGYHQNIKAQALRFKLGNGLWFKPDFIVFCKDGMMAYEVKGPHAFRGGFENLKVAAGLYPEVRWILVWKQDGHWTEQDVLP